jgi:hypothetical protein
LVHEAKLLLQQAAAFGLTFFALPEYHPLCSGVSGHGTSFTSPSAIAMNASRLSLFVFLFALATTLTSCDAIAGIFKAGAYTGIIAVVIVLALVFFIVSKMRGPRP